MTRFNPRTLFAASEPGAWYDTSDLGTLFQDSAGTVPVTAVEQPVGRILDKSGRGNHATQATTTKRPVLSRRVNVFTESEFRNGLADAPTGGGLISASALSGYSGAIAFGHDGVTGSYAYKSATPLNGFSAILSVVVKMTDGGVPVVNSSGSGDDFMLVVNGGAVIGSVASMGEGFYRIISQPTVINASNIGVVKYHTNSSRTFKVTAYDLRRATDAHLPYQRVNTSTDYDADPAKFPAYLSFDGVDDALQTGNIDFTSTDKMTVWAGVTKLSDAAFAAIVSTGIISAVPGFYLGNSIGGQNFVSRGRGSVLGATTTASGYAAPNTSILTGIFDISGSKSNLRVNGALTTNSSSLGTGNFSNSPMYIGASDGTSSYFKGRLYSLIVRGAQSSLSQIEATELYTKQKMRLP